MTEAEKLLQAELQLLAGGLIELENIKTALTENSSGVGVKEAVNSLETTLSRLALLEKRKEELLQRTNKATLKDCLLSGKKENEQTSVIKLINKIHGLKEKLKKELKTTRELLDRSKKFVDFHINVITSTKASVTYAPSGEDGALENRKVKMFDANV